jgi:hypothetical protein
MTQLSVVFIHTAAFGALLMEAEAVSKMETISILTRLIAHEDSIVSSP